MRRAEKVSEKSFLSERSLWQKRGNVFSWIKIPKTNHTKAGLFFGSDNETIRCFME
jgi:hypothetical protein